MLTNEASRLEKLCGMDAIGECGRRPNGDKSVEWTPAVSAGGIQIGEDVRNGRQWEV
ncbi:MAG: hypothetical protein MSS24_00590 [Clostridiales bacterium]|nr:hypothetical protein [Clostridiales bacterium]